MTQYDTEFVIIKRYRSCIVKMSYPFVRNKSENGTRFGRMTILKNRYLTKYNLQRLLERVNEIAVNIVL